MRTWKDWKEVHQPFELQYHIETGIAWCSDEEQFKSFWDVIFDFVGVEGKCMDLGCGPRPPFGSGSTAIDPLVAQYRKLRPEWWEGIYSYSQPAEELIPDLKGRFQTVMCWNCIDHTIGWKQILKNLKSYGAKNATYAVATDFKPPHQGHPGFDRQEFFSELEQHFQIVNYRENFQDRDVAMVLRCA